MNDEFPFQVVYDYFAHRLVAHGLPDFDDDSPLAFTSMVMVENNQVVRVEMLPLAPMVLNQGAEAIFTMVREIMDKMGNMEPLPPFCLVVAVEALTLARRVEKHTPRRAMTAEEIATDADTRRSVVLMVNRPDQQRLGMLDIGADGQVSYGPMLSADGVISTGEEFDAKMRSELH